jgi:hypothetical protein
MTDSLFARLGNDPTRIFAHFYGQPAPGGIARLGGPAMTEEAPGDGPEPAFVASADRPPGAEGQTQLPLTRPAAPRFALLRRMTSDRCQHDQRDGLPR